VGVRSPSTQAAGRRPRCRAWRRRGRSTRGRTDLDGPRGARTLRDRVAARRLTIARRGASPKPTIRTQVKLAMVGSLGDPTTRTGTPGAHNLRRQGGSRRRPTSGTPQRDSCQPSSRWRSWSSPAPRRQEKVPKLLRFAPFQRRVVWQQFGSLTTVLTTANRPPN